jgi:hypothetical protein
VEQSWRLEESLNNIVIFTCMLTLEELGYKIRYIFLKGIHCVFNRVLFFMHCLY